jgi:hypothetical protein
LSPPRNFSLRSKFRPSVRERVENDAISEA